MRPRVVVSTALLGTLTPDELVAVVAHEERHRRTRAPLRRLVARTAARALFYMPILGDLSAAHVIEEEVLADAESCAIVGSRSLVRALAKLSGVRRPDPAPSLALGDASTLSYRLRAIQEGRVARPALRRLGAAVSALSQCGLAPLVVWMPLAWIH
jgi:Zn-dependent protease with chaperone function